MKEHVHTEQEILETIAFQDASGSAQRGTQHGSKLARLPVDSWQASVLRQSPDVMLAHSASELRGVMGDPEAAVVFLPQAALVNDEIIERICVESSLDKLIIWETND